MACAKVYQWSLLLASPAQIGCSSALQLRCCVRAELGLQGSRFGIVCSTEQEGEPWQKRPCRKRFGALFKLLNFFHAHIGFDAFALKSVDFGLVHIWQDRNVEQPFDCMLKPQSMRREARVFVHDLKRADWVCAALG